MPNELTLVNNKASATVDGVRDHLKVLLVSGEPNPGERAWRNLLKADANVELVHFTILRPPEKQDLTPIRELALIAFPTAELFGRKIRDFDLIVFDRYSNMGLLPPQYFDNIVEYVRRGGALAIVAGPNFAGADGLYYTPMGRIIPARPTGQVIEQPFRAALTTIGARDPVTRGLPGAGQNPPGWSQWFRQVQAVSERGVIDEGAPVLVRLMAQIGSRFGVVVSQKMLAQATPALGAFGGAAINVAFIQHFQSLAKGHFTVRRLERKYGPDFVREEYQRIAAARTPDDIRPPAA
jgi:hypothetical protein